VGWLLSWKGLQVLGGQSVGMNEDMDRIFLRMRVGDGVGEDGRKKGSVDLGGLCFVAVAGATERVGKRVRLSAGGCPKNCVRPGRLFEI
jgi:hypothetical protein